MSSFIPQTSKATYQKFLTFIETNQNSLDDNLLTSTCPSKSSVEKEKDQIDRENMVSPFFVASLSSSS